MASVPLLKSLQEISTSGAMAAMVGTKSLDLTPSKLVLSEQDLPILGSPTLRHLLPPTLVQ